MQNYLQDARGYTIAAPGGGVVGGQAYLIGSLFGVAGESAPAGQPFFLWCLGTWSLPKTAGEAYTIGEALYWNAAGAELTSSSNSGANQLVGKAVAVALAGDAAAAVRVFG